LRRLETTGYVSSAQLANELGVSEMTIRRDVRQLQLEGLARRVAGGAAIVGGMTFDERTHEGADEKRAIAQACAPLLAGAATIALDAGTTVAPVVELIAAGTTVVSHSVPVISACTQRDDLELIGIGGVYQSGTRSFAGPGARAAVQDFSLDVAVLSATAIDADGIRCANVLDAEMKRQMSACAALTIVLADHAKLEARAPIRVGPVTLADILVTDARASAGRLDEIRAAGVRVVVADDEASAAI